MTEVNEDLVVETVTEDGEKIKFEVIDVIEFEEKEYAILAPIEDDETDEGEMVLMRLIEEGEDYSFESIEDDEEFERVSQYIDSLAEEYDEEETEE